MRTGLSVAFAVLSLLACSSEQNTPSPPESLAGNGGGPTAAGSSSGGANVAGSTSSAGETSGGRAGAAGSGGTPQAGASSTGGSAGSGSAGSAGMAGSGGGGAASACPTTLTNENRAAVAAALDGLFIDKKVSTIDQYWSDPYLQHNPVAESGVEAFSSIMSSLVASPSFTYKRLRTLADCDLAVVQGQYSGTGVIFDMFRLKDGKLVEHWDSDSNQASDAGGSTEHVTSEPSAGNRAKVLEFIQQTLIDGKTATASELLSSSYVEHRAAQGSGPQAFIDYVTTDAITYSKVHHVIADGNLVFTLSEGKLNGSAYAFYDLFRVQDGAIVEHWDSRRKVPASTASGLGIF